MAVVLAARAVSVVLRMIQGYPLGIQLPSCRLGVRLPAQVVVEVTELVEVELEGPVVELLPDVDLVLEAGRTMTFPIFLGW